MLSRYARGEAERIELSLPDIAGVDYGTAALSLSVSVTWEKDGTTKVLAPWTIAGQTATFEPTGSELDQPGVVRFTPNLTANGEVYRLAEVRDYVRDRGP